MAEIGLSRLGAKRGEFRTIERYDVFAAGMHVVEGFEQGGRVVGRVLGALGSEQGYAA